MEYMECGFCCIVDMVKFILYYITVLLFLLFYTSDFVCIEKGVFMFINNI